MVSIFDPRGDELTRRHPPLGDLRHAIRHRVRFIRVLAGIEIVHPRPDEINAIHTTCVERAAAGKDLRKGDKLTAMAKTLVQRDGVDAIILPGTDLAVLLESHAEFPCVDYAALHIDEILKR